MTLYARRQSTFRPWSKGAAQFLCNHVVGQHRLIVGVACRLGTSPVDHVALLDTGAERSIVSPRLAELLGSDLGECLRETRLSSRYGVVDAELRRLEITLLADPDDGHDVIVPSVVAIPSLWDGPVILGFFGFLEFLHVALEPGQDSQTPSMFYFGPA